MCQAYPQRRQELDLYERDIIDMATRYPGNGFYEYHRQFSLMAPSHLRIITFSLTGLCGKTLYFVICLRMPDRSHVQPSTVRCTLQAFAPLPTN